MIIQQNNRVVILEDGDEMESTDMEIDSSGIGKLMDFLSEKIYQDAEGSSVRETVSNSYDSHISIDSNSPILVNLMRTSTGSWEFTVEDFGKGLGKEDVENVIKKYLKSTKENCDKQLGNRGLGFKSPLAYTKESPFYFICRKDRIEIKCMMYKGALTNKIDYIYEKETTEANGVKIIIPVQSYDVNTFSSKIREQLCYFKNIYVTDNYRTYKNDYKIYENELFKFSDNPPDSLLHLCLDQVYYPLDFKQLNINPIYLPIAINVKLTDGIEPIISRENIIYNNFSKEFIKEKIKQIAKFFVEKYNSNNKEFSTFLEAYSFINTSTKEIELEGKKFNITELEQYSDVKFEEPKVKGVELKSPKYYKGKRDSFIDGHFEIIAYEDSSSMWKKKNEYIGFRHVVGGEKIVLFNGTLAGNVKEYLRNKHGRRTKYIRHARDRKLNGSMYFEGYKSLLLLTNENKTQWRDLIKEWQYIQKTITDTFSDETEVENSIEYIEWLNNKKEAIKANREKGIYKGKTLGKVEGDITIAYSRLSALDRKSVVFEKKAYPIKDLYKNPFLTIYWEDTPENKIEAAMYNPLTNKFKLKIALIGKRELNKIKITKNMIEVKDYQKTKQFRKFTSSIKAKEVIDIYTSISGSSEALIQNVVKDYYDDVQNLRKYINANFDNYVSDQLKSSMMAIAEEYNLFDLEIMPVISRIRENLSKYDFIPMLKVPSYYDETSKKKYSRMIHQMILFKKLYANQFNEFDIVCAPPIEVLEELYAVDSSGELLCENCEEELV